MSNVPEPVQVPNLQFIDYLEDRYLKMKKDFEVEMDAKNQAYAFILSHGLLTQFSEFSRTVYSDDWHATCLEQVKLLSTYKN